MKKYLFSAISILLLLSMLSSATTLAHAQSDRWYGIGYIFGSFKGAQANIHWANPTVRDSGGFSAETLWVNSYSAGKWVEVGWTKEDPPNDPRPMGTYLYYAWNNGTYHEKILEATTSHNVYKIVYAAANNWYIYINGVLRATVNAGFSTADLIEVGGEVTSNKNAMGVSGTLSLMYKHPTNIWFSWLNTQVRQDLPYYHVIKLNKSNANLQNYGNNP